MVDEAVKGAAGFGPDTHVVRDAEGLRALSHPTRQRLLAELVTAGHGRAADLAQLTGQAANAVSFHLRTLARAGLIEEAPELARDRRDRVWRPVADSFTVDPATVGFTTLFRPYANLIRDNLARGAAAGGQPELAEPDRSLMLASAIATPAQVEDLATRLTALIQEWTTDTVAAARDEPGAAGRQVYRLVWAAGPAVEPQP